VTDIQAPEAGLRAAAHEIRMRLNPHPAGQLLLNAPSLHGRPLPGLQHKYPETACWLTDLEPVFADRFPFESARYKAVPDELSGLFPSEPDEPGRGASSDLAGSPSACLVLTKTDHPKVPAVREQQPYLTATVTAGHRGVISTANAAQAPGEARP
jgi:hypothetical protein